MKVILTKDVLSLGETGDIVDVSDGYARNYLLPSGFAETASDGALKKREQNLARIKAKAEKVHKQAMETSEAIKAVGKVTIHAKAGETGKLYGAITTRQLAQILQEKTGKDIDRKNLNLSNPINHTGEFKVTIKLSSKVSVEVPVDVTGDLHEPMMTEEYKAEIEEMEEEKQKQREEQQKSYEEAQAESVAEGENQEAEQREEAQVSE